MRRLATATIVAVFEMTAHADPITFLDTVFGASGSLNGTSFANAQVIGTFTGDTSNMTLLAGVGPVIPVSGSVFVQGLGSATLTDSPMYLISAGSGVLQLGSPGVAFLDEGPGGIGWGQTHIPGDGCSPSPCYGIGVFVSTNSALAGYNLSAPFGPVTSSVGGGATVAQIAPLCRTAIAPNCAYYPTDSGGFFYWTDPGTSSTFAAPVVSSGGTPTAPVVLGGGVSEVLGSIGGLGTQDWYQFYWQGGAFSTSALVQTTSPGAVYQFSLDSGPMPFINTVANGTLNSSDQWAETLTVANLPAGTYGIGVTATSSADPNVIINFASPVSTPEPSSISLLLGVLAVIGVALVRRRHGIS